jgi:L-asparaginase II
MPLAALARAWARLADPARESADRRAAILRVRAAMAAEPFLVAGTGRFTTRVIAATHGAVLVKEGAEGVYCGAVPARGLGIALKAADGASRAAPVAIGEVLRRLGALDGAAAGLADVLQPTLRNHSGRAVGTIRIAAGTP